MMECLDTWIRVREKMKFMKKIEREGRMCKPGGKEKARVIKKQVKF